MLRLCKRLHPNPAEPEPTIIEETTEPERSGTGTKWRWLEAIIDDRTEQSEMDRSEATWP